MKTVIKLSFVALCLTLFGLWACSEQDNLLPKQDSTKHSSAKSTGVTDTSTVDDVAANTYVILGGNGSLTVQDIVSNASTSFNSWATFYTFYQSKKTGGCQFMFRNGLTNTAYTAEFVVESGYSGSSLLRRNGSTYVAVLSNTTADAIIERLNTIAWVGTPAHQAAVKGLNVQCVGLVHF